jgi:glycosyltransferase involved in cell wall biosynthesis
MRIVFVTPYYYPELKFGGPPKRLHGLSRGLRALGHEIRVATFNSEDANARALATVDTIEVQYLPWIGRGLRQLPVSWSPLQEAIDRADVVHCYGLYNLLLPLTAGLAWRRRKPFLFEPMGMYVPRVRTLFAKRLYNAIVTKPLARRAAAVVATSPLEMEELRSLGAEVNLVVRPNGVDLAEFSSLPSVAPMRRRWGATTAEKIVLFLGRIDAKKNLRVLVNAFVDAAVPQSRLVIAGPASDNRYTGSLRRLIEERRACDRIYLDGPLYGEEHLAALAAADLFVLPSINENFGNSAAEAVAAGVPVLITETCGVAPIIDGRAGLSVSLGVESLRDGIRAMLDPQRRAAVTAKRDEVKRELSVDEAIRQTEQLYVSIVTGAA